VQVKISKVEIGTPSILVSFVLINHSVQNIYLFENSYLDRTSTAPTLPMRGASGRCLKSDRWRRAPTLQRWDTPPLDYMTLRPSETLKGSYVMDKRQYPCPLPSRFRLEIEWYTHPPRLAVRHPEKGKTASVETDIKAE
jgi:hypothetical protein